VAEVRAVVEAVEIMLQEVDLHNMEVVAEEH
jgi:hypothetical protein